MRNYFGLFCILIEILSVYSAPESSSTEVQHQSLPANHLLQVPNEGTHRHLDKDGKEETDTSNFNPQCLACRKMNYWRREKEDVETENFVKCHKLYLALNKNEELKRRGQPEVPLREEVSKTRDEHVCDQFYLPMFMGEIPHIEKPLFFDPKCKTCREKTYFHEGLLFQADSWVLGKQTMDKMGQILGFQFNNAVDAVKKGTNNLTNSVRGFMRRDKDRNNDNSTVVQSATETPSVAGIDSKVEASQESVNLLKN